ncbi:sialidase family protein [Prosthecobacter sp.]|uniref:sialidase family protein n=1 Tax=Prosthecobacter sp. TaxID=1965333 RepID=UPI003783BDFA
MIKPHLLICAMLVAPLLPLNTFAADDAKLEITDASKKKEATSTLTLPADQKQNVIVYKEAGRYGGWPANHGLWQWGDELVAGFTSTWYKQTTTDHRIDRTKPSYEIQARSVDGGKTWKTEEDVPFKDPKNEAKPVALKEPLDFTEAGFALMFRFGGLHAGPSWFYTSVDRCKTWKGPYSFSVPGVEGICTRTDLIVLGKQDCLMFGSCGKKNDGKEGRVFCARTTDGGVNWSFVSWIGPEPMEGGYAIMPSSLRLKDGTILTTIRRSDPKVSGFIESWRSTDLGKTWTQAGMVATHIGGNPPAMVQLQDGRVAVSFGHRHKPSGMRAAISADGGVTWGPQIVLREDGFDGDLGYPRSVVRPDGKVLTVYYYNGPKEDDRAIEGTFWRAP